MKKTYFTIILFLVSLAAISSAYAQSGPPALQEVEATGQGATEDDAFKQAVVDAVRQVVGTLVSAENVVKNDQVIKDEVLTLSNGFVEKVINQNKTKLNDGTWQIKLKCIVRKEQLYSKLQEEKVPTVKFEGASLFADIVSQQAVEKDSSALLIKAILGWNGSFYKAVSLSTKPELISKNENTATIRMSCRVSLLRDVYESQFLAKMTNLLESIAVRKLGNKVEDLRWENVPEGKNIIYVDGVSGCYVIDSALLGTMCTQVGRTDLFRENMHADVNVFAVFWNSADECLLITHVSKLWTYTRAGEYARAIRISPKLHDIQGHYPVQDPSDGIDFTLDMPVPVKSLSQITKIELHVATTLDCCITYYHLPAEAPGELVYFSNEWVGPGGCEPWKFIKPNANKPSLHMTSDLYYLPTLDIKAVSGP